MTDKPAPSDSFRAMADRIDRNDPKEFAGAYLLIAPDGTVLSHLFVNPGGDASSFWGFVLSAVQIAGAESVQKEEDKVRLLGFRR